jgi:hypothetical protein
LLQHEFRIPLDSITWVVAIDVPLRPDVRHSLVVETIPPGKNLRTLLMQSNLDAMIGPLLYITAQVST